MDWDPEHSDLQGAHLQNGGDVYCMRNLRPSSTLSIQIRMQGRS